MHNDKRVTRKCKWCHKEFHPRLADVKRGWGQYCSKVCKAKYQVKYMYDYPPEDPEAEIWAGLSFDEDKDVI